MQHSREYAEYIKSARWKATAKLIKESRGYVCARCGKATWSVEAHHLTYERLGRELTSDIELVCKDCHPKADHERAKRTEHKREEARVDSAYATYVYKKYGDDPRAMEDPAIMEEFHEWLHSRYQ